MATLIRSSDVVRIAGLRSAAAVSNWRRRPGLDFPAPVAGTASRPLFDADEVVAWLRAHDPARYADLTADEGDQWLLSAFDGLAAEIGAERSVDVCFDVLCAMRAARLDASRAKAFAALPATLGALARFAAESALPGTGEDLLALVDEAERDAALFARAAALIEAAKKAGDADPAELSRALLDRAVRSLPRSGAEFGAVDSPVSHLLACLATGRALKDAPARSSLAERIPELLETLALPRVRIRRVEDPAAGLGETLLRIAQGKAKREVKGYERSARHVGILAKRLYVEGVAGEASLGDIVDAAPTGTADLVVVEPPFGTRLAVVPTDPRWAFGVPRGAASEFAWIEDAIARLAPGGRALVVTPVAALNAPSAPAVAIRRSLVQRGCVRAIIALPGRLYRHSSAETAIWVLERPGAVAATALVDLSIAEGGAAIPVERIGVERLVEDLRVRLSPKLWIGARESAGDPRPKAVEALEALGASASGLVSALGALKGAPARGATHLVTIRELESSRAIRFARTDERAEDECVDVISASDVRTAAAASDALGECDRAASAQIEQSINGLTESDDVLLAIDGEPAALVDETGGHAIGTDVRVLRADPKALDPKFLAVCLAGEWNRRFLVGGTVSNAALGDFEIPALPLEAQREWVARLDEFDAARQAAASVTQAASEARRAALDVLRFGGSPG